MIQYSLTHHLQEKLELLVIWRILDRIFKDLAELVVVWVQCDVEVCRQRMIARNSDRDTWKLENWDEYIKKINFTVPDGIKNLFLFNNSSDEAFKKSLDEAVEYFKNLK